MDGGSAPDSGLVGPNSVIQLGHAIAATLGADAAGRVFASAHAERYLAAPPDAMVDQRIPAALFRELWRQYPQAATPIAAKAGELTADYIIANRIPRLARIALSVLPRAPAARMLLSAIETHAWTFAGSGHCTVGSAPNFRIAIAANPLAMPGCIWHRAVFARLFDRLVARGAACRQTACCRNGAPACAFEILLAPAKG